MVFSALKQHRLLLIFACVLSMVGAGLGVSILSLLNQQIENFGKVSPHISQFFVFLGLVGAMVVVGVGAQSLLATLSANIVTDLRRNITQRILEAEFEELERIGGNQIYATLTGDIARISRGITILPEYVYNLFTTALCLVYIGYLSLGLLGFIVCIIVLAIILVQVFLSRATLFLEALRKNDDDLFEHYQSMVEGSKELNINVKRKRFFYRDLFLPTIAAARKNSIQSQLYFTFLGNFSNAFIFIAMIGLMFGATWFLPELKVAVLVGVMLTFVFMIAPLSFVIDSASSIGDAMIGYKKIIAFENIFTTTKNKALALTKTEASANAIVDQDWKSIHLKEICYRYDSKQGGKFDDFSIGPMSLTFSRGEVIFITGGNGSGKSTFAKLITGLYTPSSGSLSIDGKALDYRQDMTEYRQLFSTIFSDFYLFKNVLDATGAAAADDIVSSHLKSLSLDKKVDSKDGLLSTIRLSHGQRKRLALLQSYIEDCPICLYDEWAADQDAYFRSYFYTTILPELKSKNKLVIVISHDDRYFDCCDRLFKLDEGKIVESTVVRNPIAVTNGVALGA